MNSYLIKNFQTGVPLSQPMALDHLRLIVYGQAYIETIKLNKNDNYKIFSVENLLVPCGWNVKISTPFPAVEL